MPIILFRGTKTPTKQKLMDLLQTKFHYLFLDIQGISSDTEINQIESSLIKLSEYIKEKRIVLINGFFFTQQIINHFFKRLDADESLTYILLRTEENNLSKNSDILEHEILIHDELNDLDKVILKIHKIILTLRTIEYYAKQINQFPTEDYEPTLRLKDPYFFETTSYLLLSKPLFGFVAMITEILKNYYFNNKKDFALTILLELVKFIQVMGFNIRKGARFFRVCHYMEDANYTTLDQIWYPKQTKRNVRISNIDESVLFINEHWGSAFLEVHEETGKKRPFIILEMEVIKPFKINYNGPLDLQTHPGASQNNMYMDYCRDCKKIEPELLRLKEELIRNFIGEFWVSNKNFDHLFTYDFTQNMSKLLLNRFKGEGLGYLSTQCNYQYNNFAIPASTADDCLRPLGVVLCDYEFWPNGRGKPPWIHFEKLKTGVINPLTREITYNI